MLFYIISSSKYKYIINKHPSESNDQFYFRCKYILDLVPENNTQFTQYELESFKMRNIKYNKYKY